MKEAFITEIIFKEDVILFDVCSKAGNSQLSLFALKGLINITKVYYKGIVVKSIEHLQDLINMTDSELIFERMYSIVSDEQAYLDAFEYRLNKSEEIVRRVIDRVNS